MTSSNLYYAVYDISSNDTREGVIRILKDSGMVRIQKSVFSGKLAEQLKKDVLEKIKMIISVEDDSFYLIMSCNSCFGKLITMGKSFDKEYVNDELEGMVL